MQVLQNDSMQTQCTIQRCSSKLIILFSANWVSLCLGKNLFYFNQITSQSSKARPVWNRAPKVAASRQSLHVCTFNNSTYFYFKSKASTHCSIHQPFLEVLLPRLWFLQVSSALCSYPVHQTLLQVRVVLLVDLLLHLSAQSITGPSVCHARPLSVISV